MAKKLISFDDAAASGTGLPEAVETVLNATYAPSYPAVTTIVYDGENVSSVTESGVTTTYTYNPDGSVATDTRNGVTRAYTYDGSGNLTNIEVQ